MPKQVMRLRISGKPRPEIDVMAMANIIIALGRELAAREREKREVLPAAGVMTP